MMITETSSQEFHLFVERPADGAAVAGLAPGELANKLVVPAGVWCLQVTAEQGPQLLRLPPETMASAVLLEASFAHRPQPRLLALTPGVQILRVNGQPAPRLAVLTERDTFQVNDDWIFHVAIFNRPRIGPPGPELIGRPCPVCLVPFAAGAKVQLCHCGAAFHCEEPGGLECIQMNAECQACGRPFVLTAGYTALPELIHA